MTATSSASTTTPSSATTITGLYRHAVKGLSADELDSVTIQGPKEAFPDDRRFALLKQKPTSEKFDPENPEWLHKSNFLCAFSAPALMTNYRASYSLQRGTPSSSFGLPNDNGISEDGTTKRLLSLHERYGDEPQLLLDAVDLSQPAGRQELAAFFSNVSGESLTCVTADDFQFGNTSSGVKKKQNTRTVHIINAATVREVSDVIGVPLNPTRFRPNIVIDHGDLKPWEEFTWIDKRIQLGSTLKMDVIQRTVRCDAVSVDPLTYPDDVLDIPALLAKHFPEHGPYLGVYAHIEEGGTMKIGDTVTLLD